MSDDVARVVSRWGLTVALCLVSIEQATPSAAQSASPVHFAATSLKGDSVRVGRGQLAIVNVFATWCTTCKAEFPALDTLTRDLKPGGISVVALDVDDAPRGVVLRFAEAHHPAFPVVFDSAGAIARSLAIVGVPETFLIAADGRVIWHQRGPIDHEMAALRAAILACTSPPSAGDHC